jgi:hypothetical protein
MAERRAYGDANRAFLQAFMARGSITVDQGKEILAHVETLETGQEVSADGITDERFQDYVSIANDSIGRLDLEIRSILSQTSNERKRIYALVNTTSDPMSQLATTYSADEIAYINRLIDAMFETYNTTRSEVIAVTSMQALDLNTPRPNEASQNAAPAQALSKRDAERVLGNLVDEGWLTRSRRNYYTLSPRALMELRHFLIATYNDEDDEDSLERVKLCAACKDIVTIVRS